MEGGKGRMKGEYQQRVCGARIHVSTVVWSSAAPAIGSTIYNRLDHLPVDNIYAPEDRTR